MGKKKSKTQKYKKNIRKKQNKIAEQKNKKIDNIVKKEEEKKEKKDTFHVISNKKEKKFSSSKKNIPNLKPSTILQKRHIVLNVLLLLSFFFFLLGLITVEVYSGKLILFITCILLFLILVAISYTKYTSGKIFSLFLLLIIGFSTYKLQYNYDFIRSLNTHKYEKKIYYIVTFDTNINRSVYVLNSKKIGLLKENKTYIERKLNTKLDNITYITYENINELTDSFYNQEFRGIIVDENQYKYLQNSNYNKPIKILYEFNINTLKESTL